MRVALFSDVHGNAVAFDAFLADLDTQEVDRVVCLGDHAQGGPQPAQVLERLRERGWVAVMGNSDHFFLTDAFGDEEVTDAQLEIASWSRAQLTEDLLEFHRSFQPTVELEMGDGRTLLAFHATPRSREEIVGPWMDEEQFREPFTQVDANLLAGGHTHQQWARRLGDRYYVNPGSVGLAYDHLQDRQSFRADPFAEYAVVTVDDSVTVEWRRVRFQAADVLRAITESGMPHPELAAELWRADYPRTPT